MATFSEQRSLLSSGCASTNDCWKNPHIRDSNLDFVISIITIGLLVLGVAISFFITNRCRSVVSEPTLKSTQQSAYDRATVIFSYLFQQPAESSVILPVADRNMPPTQILVATRERNRRCLIDSSYVMDLSTETNIVYSGSTLKNHIIAQKDHLEYDFGSSSELESLAKQYFQARRSFMPPILECTSRCDSFDNLSFLLPQEELIRRQQFQRKFVLFFGREERHRWLPSNEGNVEFTRDRLWNFSDLSTSVDEFESKD